MTFVLLLLTSVTLITLDYREVPVVESVSDAGASVVGVVTDGLGAVFRPVGNLFGSDDGLEAENERLRRQLDELRSQQVVGVDAQQQLLALQQQLDLSFVGDLETEVARVVSGAVANFDDHFLTIDKGSEAGFEVGMPVVTSAGLVGSIEDVARGRSTVHLITDPAFNVGVKLVTSQDQAVGRGTGPRGPMLVDQGVELTTDVPEFEGVVTSGGAGVRSRYPAGLVVGTVADVSSGDGEGTQVVEVDLAVDFDDLDVVQVIRWVPEG